MDRDPLARRLTGFGTTIFAEMSELAVAHDAVNLGQGFPDTDGPTEVLDAAVEAIRGGRNQYPPGSGVRELRVAIARHQQHHHDLLHDPDTEVLVTAGATEALAAAMLGLLDPGDEVVVFEPLYDAYAACISMAGARAVPVTLHEPGFTVDPTELAAAMSSRTRMVLLNTPHNPTGVVFDGDTLSAIATHAVERDLVVVSDEVYEHLTFDGRRHRPIATLPGMAERTLTVSSAGKTFNVTGWKVGWVCGPADLVTAVRTAKQFLTYVASGPFQPAIAVGLGLPDSYFRGVAAGLERARDHLVAGLRAVGLTPHVPHAGYFVVADIRPLDPAGDGVSFCRSLPERCGVAAVPVGVFYAPGHEHLGRHLVRFAFCKRLEVIDEAVARLATLSA